MNVPTPSYEPPADVCCGLHYVCRPAGICSDSLVTSATGDGRCPRCRHSLTGYHVGPSHCGICTRENGPCQGRSA